jgi:hypothetical protein
MKYTRHSITLDNISLKAIRHLALLNSTSLSGMLRRLILENYEAYEQRENKRMDKLLHDLNAA